MAYKIVVRGLHYAEIDLKLPHAFAGKINMVGDPGLAEDMGGRFDHVLVDEYQDTNRLHENDYVRAHSLDWASGVGSIY